MFQEPNLVIAIPTFIGSLASFIATTVVIVLHIFIPPKRHFRHALILSLLIADCINSLDNTISGAITLARGQSDVADAGCIVNAFVNQLTVSAVDWNILIISITVLCTVLDANPVAESSMTKTVLICLAAWLPGIVTSFIGLGLNAYGQVSGNWCWIRSEHLLLRYILTHGWRLAIFFATICIYTYIYIHLRRVFGRTRLGGSGLFSSQSVGSGTFDSELGREPGEPDTDTQRILASTSYEVTMELNDQKPATGTEGNSKGLKGEAQWSVSTNTKERSKKTRFESVNSPPTSSAPKLRPLSRSHMPASPNLKRMMLMNGYPMAYIILWIPGIANRLNESINGSSPVWLKALQATTQFVGLVNALTYGFSEQRLQALKSVLNRRRGFRATSE